MPRRDRRQPGPIRANGAWAAVLALGLAACAHDAPATAVRDLNWACGAQRCTASFRLANDGTGDESLRVFVRAYAGGSVAGRQIVGEHREQLRLRAGQSRRFDVSFELRRPASRLRVVVEPAAN
jgi:hypothetical protein